MFYKNALPKRTSGFYFVIFSAGHFLHYFFILRIPLLLPNNTPYISHPTGVFCGQTVYLRMYLFVRVFAYLGKITPGPQNNDFFILMTHEGSHREFTRNSNTVMTFSLGRAKGCLDHRFRAPSAYNCPIANSASTQTQQPV